MYWISDNYKWLFDGVAGAAVIAVIGWLFHHFSQGRQRGTAGGWRRDFLQRSVVP